MPDATPSLVAEATTGPPQATGARRAVAEFTGTGFLVAAVVGSGIAATRLSPHQPGLQLLINSLTTGAALTALILALHPVSAAFNPVVTLLEVVRRIITPRLAVTLLAAQFAGGAAGAVLANLMFALPAVDVSAHDRVTGPALLAETVATLGLVLVIGGTVRTRRSETVAVAVGAYITAAYWFTSSTSFANPAVTIARTLTDTFAGISPASTLPFIAAQLIGGAIGGALVYTLFIAPSPSSDPPH